MGRLLAEIAFRGGYIEAWGRGINKITEACKNAGIEDPEFEENTNGFLLTLKIGNQATPQVKKLLKYLEGKEKSKKNLMDDIGIKDEKYFKDSFLEPALKNNLIEMTIPDKPNSPLQKYRLKKILPSPYAPSRTPNPRCEI